MIINIFVKIKDCPSWLHEELQKTRNEQLAVKEKTENQKRQKEKRRRFWKRIFPFLK